MLGITIKIIGFFFLSTVKFAVATLPIAVAFPFEQALLISISGGITGAFFFMYLWARILKIWYFFISKKPTVDDNKIQINRKRRRVVKLKNTYGYWGIIFLTPSLLSIPLGAFILMNFFKKRRYIFLHLSMSIAIWGVLLVGFFSLF
jgi:hypothetical protein